VLGSVLLFGITIVGIGVVFWKIGKTLDVVLFDCENRLLFMPKKRIIAKNTPIKRKVERVNRMPSYFTIYRQVFFSVLVLLLGVMLGVIGMNLLKQEKQVLSSEIEKQAYWFLLKRKSNIELLYKGVPGDEAQSLLVKTFVVKTGIPGEKPTPLPRLLGREYWVIIAKEVSDNPETAPYFLTLNVPVEEDWFGPSPYLECKDPETGNAVQCFWELPGYFGLHGINADESKISKENPGSSGCIRHRDEDITYLYNLIDPTKEEVRYYIEDK
jgi:hypothetical protein